ncbi:hypothetical protein B1748_14695 [Paenibacillus sp. MY03]|uniref:GNAT family N-acetyltransferase n=1 Tax=Paenibacillus sp. MY03 TaxID=302980 RepID=UPI000B3C3F29|nr:GNAT family N-acetyltransferase [Paenibacillus sp. MY03]OUS76056.1 hypothetical protein B1748_14695 [Paenibacillus sp. MY03]
MRYEAMSEKHLDGMVSVWNSEWIRVFPMREQLIAQNVFEDPNWLRHGSWVAIEESRDRIVGFVVAKAYREELAQYGLKSDAGWIQALIVEQDSRGVGIGSELLGRTEEALRKLGVQRISLGNDLQSRLFPGLPEPEEATKGWFEKRGYVFKAEVFDLLNSYNHRAGVTLPEVQDALFRVATPEDRERMTAFMRRCFPGTWDYQHREYWKRGGTGREYVLLEREGIIIGFCRMNDEHSPLLAQNIYWSPLFDEPLGGIGPLGIDEAYRGYRYGISIVQAAIHYLLERGSRHIVIDTTPFVEFYGKLGYTNWRTYAKFEKTIDLTGSSTFRRE